MSCFGGRVSQDLYQNCCNANVLCEFDGDMSRVVSEPIYVQKVYDAVLVHLQGMKTVQNQSFVPALPCGHRVKRVIDIRCRRSFNPQNVDDPTNLKLDVNTSISGATFLKNASGDELTVVGADGNFSEKLLYAETGECDDKCMGTPIFGTQNISITSNVSSSSWICCLPTAAASNPIFTVATTVNVANATASLWYSQTSLKSACHQRRIPHSCRVLRSSAIPACRARLATNSCSRDRRSMQMGKSPLTSSSRCASAAKRKSSFRCSSVCSRLAS